MLGLKKGRYKIGLICIGS